MDNIKKHHIKFKPPNKSADIMSLWAELEGSLKEIPGMMETSINTEKHSILIKYDLKKCREEVIEKCVSGSGLELDDSFLQRFKRGYIQFTEENEIETMKDRRTCCSDADEIERRKKTVRSK